MRARSLLLLAPLWALLATAAAQPSAPPPDVEVVRAGEVASVQVNGVVVLRLRGAGAVSRAEAVAGRLRALPSRTDASVRLVPQDGAVDVVVDGVRVFTADVGQARANRTSPYALASAWARALRTALAVRQLWLEPSAVAVALGGDALVEVKAVPASRPEVGPFDTRTVGLRWESDTRLRVFGRRPGTVRVPLRHGTATRELVVSVRPLAGRLPRSVEAVVTGQPAPAEVVREAVLRVLESTVQTEPGAVLEVSPVDTPSVAPGELWRAEVTARIRSPYAMAVEGSVSVSVRNEPVELLPPARLLVSNNPERMAEDGVLFREWVRGGEAVRMLYHHANGADRDKVVTVWLRNPHAAPARVHLQLATPGAWHDTMATGHAAARRFLELTARGAGYVLDLPPGRAHRFTTQRTPPGHVVSGLIQVQVLEGGPLEVAVSARTVYVLDRAVQREVEPLGTPHPRGVFGSPLVRLERTLAVGAGERVEIGRSQSLRDLRTGRLLDGDYGVTYFIRLHLTNPSDQPAPVELVLVASSGPAYATFLVDGQLVDLRFLASGRAATVLATTLQPREVRTVELVTMPEAASWYPVRLELRTP